MGKSIKDLKVGDQMAVVRLYSNKSGVEMKAIQSIGRTWITFSPGVRVDRQTLKGDLLMAYVDMDAYNESIRMEKLRDRLRHGLAKATDDQVEQLAKILGIS